MNSVNDYINLNDLSKLNVYRERLFAFINRDAYKGDCGDIEIKLPGVSCSYDGHGEPNGLNFVGLHVRCYGATDTGRSHYYGGKTLGDAVDQATEALLRWEQGVWEEE